MPETTEGQLCHTDQDRPMGHVRPVGQSRPMGQMRPKVKSDQILFTLFLF